ncbi:cytochrome P450 6B4-like [Oppia nitens]|uniref:cytochrome P450 6B4-like n=1 Tax=Oppia nitens TaxID=1686743 RepID=UPI0023D97FEC|nr:cytochrome P450 6B4-like [Oppia nitens]
MQVLAQLFRPENLKQIRQTTETVCRQFVAKEFLDRKPPIAKLEVKHLMDELVIKIMIVCSFGRCFDDVGIDFNRFMQSVPKFDQNRRLMLATLIWPRLVDPVFRLYDKLFGGRQQYFIDSVRKLVEHRRRQCQQIDKQLMANTTDAADDDNDNDDYNHKDFLQVFLDYRHNKSDDNNHNNNNNNNRLIDEEIISLFYVTFLSGFEPMCLMLTMSVYELANNPDIQRRLYDELTSDRTDNNNKGSTDLSDLTYLNAVLMEILRKYPAIITNRRATEDIHLPDVDLSVPKGTDIDLSFISMYYNPQYFPDPQVYNPDRFMPESADKLVKHSFIPFGSGQVVYCVGERFARVLMKHVLIALVRTLEFKPCVSVTAKPVANLFKMFPDLLLPNSLDIEYKIRKF